MYSIQSLTTAVDKHKAICPNWMNNLFPGKMTNSSYPRGCAGPCSSKTKILCFIHSVNCWYFTNLVSWSLLLCFLSGVGAANFLLSTDQCHNTRQGMYNKSAEIQGLCTSTRTAITVISASKVLQQYMAKFDLSASIFSQIIEGMSWLGRDSIIFVFQVARKNKHTSSLFVFSSLFWEKSI